MERQAPLDALSVWVIYKNPRDYPAMEGQDLYVVREQWASRAGTGISTEAAVRATLDDARECVPFGLFCFERQVNDDATIVESWL